DSKSLAVFDVYDSSISVWDVETGKERCKFGARPSFRPVNSRTSPTGRLAFAPDGKMLALGGEGSAVRFFDATKGKELNAEGHLTPITQLSFARDAKTILAADEGRNVVAWNVATGKELRRTPLAPEFVAFALSSDGRHFAAKHGACAILLRDAIADQEISYNL